MISNVNNELLESIENRDYIEIETVSIEEFQEAELDELWSYVQNKKIKDDYGLQ